MRSVPDAPAAHVATLDGRLAVALRLPRVDSYEGMPGSFAGEGPRAWDPSRRRRAHPRGRPSVGCVRRGLDDRPFPTDAQARVGAFAELVAQAIANVDA